MGNASIAEVIIIILLAMGLIMSGLGVLLWNQVYRELILTQHDKDDLRIARRNIRAEILTFIPLLSILIIMAIAAFTPPTILTSDVTTQSIVVLICFLVVIVCLIVKSFWRRLDEKKLTGNWGITIGKRTF